MLRLILLGLLAGLFFSSTFVLNKAMSLAGGHWLWSASFRYFFMILLLLAFVLSSRGIAGLRQLLCHFVRHWLFWCLAGSIGFGGFYSLICFSADYAPGWVIASTWQMTIIASLIVLVFFGRSFPKRTWLFSFIIFSGVVLVNLSSWAAINPRQILLGALPVVLAAFCYPLGNQLVWEAGRGNRYLPDISGELIDNPLNKILLLSLGSLPFWLILIVLLRPAPPSAKQLISTALVALFSGVVATGFFLSARNRAKKASELAAVDATQASEVVFAMIGEILFLRAPLPNTIAIFGIVLVFAGLGLFIGFRERQT
jgi:drug/metabolite transporter (DMT)-like permease